jgi:ADP-heptose:LPS heptosyltransferase
MVSLLNRPTPRVKPKLLVVELWGMGDLIIATPFLQAASQKYQVTLLAKPYAQDLQLRFWPEVKVLPFVAPWTAFEKKYHLFSWPWRQIFKLRRQLAEEKFDFGLSARWDPRDHFLLTIARARTRLGFPRLRSQMFLSRALLRPEPKAHRYENWRVMAQALDFQLPEREKLIMPSNRDSREILVHTGAGQPVRVWPLERYRSIVARLRGRKIQVQVACDPDQQDWWLQAGETSIAMPRSVGELFSLIQSAGAFIGNDSGPGHLAAFSGVPTLTIFGPQLPDWFAPLRPASEFIPGKACPYKPCSDYCQFPTAVCMVNSSEEEVWKRVEAFIDRALPAPSIPN